MKQWHLTYQDHSGHWRKVQGKETGEYRVSFFDFFDPEILVLEIPIERAKEISRWTHAQQRRSFNGVIGMEEIYRASEFQDRKLPSYEECKDCGGVVTVIDDFRMHCFPFCVQWKELMRRP